ncbi:MAG: N-acetylglucosamine-6-phosphate deacetylase [Succinivibrionaceae bacterium]|nr:N-acetylglucosamine-6-phosphate deacetylase [Succinivibrionaceae bacterium]
MIITNASAFIDGRFTPSDLLIRDERIFEIHPASAQNFTYIFNDERINLHGAKLYPGFIDLQINGCGGIIYNDDTSTERISYMRDINFKSGTTTFLPTLVTTSDKNIAAAVDQMFEYHRGHGRYNVPGIHIEGPFISERKSGIHNKKYIRHFTDENLEFFLANHEQIAMLTLSVEQFTEEQLRILAECGITLSIGHSSCTYDECIGYLGNNNFIRNATHLYNAMTVLSGGRNPGVAEAVFDSEIYAGIIADLCHVHPALIRSARKILGDHLYLVTDALASACAPEGFRSFRFCDKQLYVRENGFCADENGTLGGSSLTMNMGIKNLIQTCGISEKDAIEMATVIPARAINMDRDLGSIKTGKIASFTVLDDNYDCMMTISQGKVVFQKK